MRVDQQGRFTESKIFQKVWRFYIKKKEISHIASQLAFQLLFGKLEEETEEEAFWKSCRGRLGDPAFSARTVYFFCEALFECKLTVTLVKITIEYGKSCLRIRNRPWSVSFREFLF